MKKFLEEYGWTIVLAIVVILIISIASPLGSSIKGSITNIVNGFGAKANFERIDNTGSVSDNNDSGEQLDLTNINVAGVVGDFSRKGNLVTINGTQYRVLEVNGTQAKLLAMDSYKSITFGSNNTYSGSTLDVEMTNYYNALPTDVQNAIVEQNINQSKYKYSRSASSSGNDSFSSWFKSSFTESTASGTNFYLKKVSETNVGNRKVYALDIDDVISYLGSTSIPQDVNELFFNQRSSVSRVVWLRSAYAVNINNVFFVYGYDGDMSTDGINRQYEVRPAFVLDLSLLG